MLLDEVSQISYIFCSFELIACDHHDLDACSLQPGDGFGNIVLEAIFNACGSQNGEMIFQFFNQLLF